MNKRKISWVMLLCCLLAFNANLLASGEGESDKGMSDKGMVTNGMSGTFEGTGEGLAGPITVKITVENGKIVAGELVSISDSDFTFPAVDQILAQAVQTGSAENLDIIAGASSASRGTIDAIKAALAFPAGVSYEKVVYASPDEITIKVSVLDGKITGGKIISESESALAFPAVTTILAQAVENGNADNLDMVSGATVSSKAAITAIQEILAESQEK